MRSGPGSKDIINGRLGSGENTSTPAIQTHFNHFQSSTLQQPKCIS
jgi:hypothetical protein